MVVAVGGTIVAVGVTTTGVHEAVGGLGVFDGGTVEVGGTAVGVAVNVGVGGTGVFEGVKVKVNVEARKAVAEGSRVGVKVGSGVDEEVTVGVSVKLGVAVNKPGVGEGPAVVGTTRVSVGEDETAAVVVGVLSFEPGEN